MSSTNSQRPRLLGDRDLPTVSATLGKLEERNLRTVLVVHGATLIRVLLDRIFTENDVAQNGGPPGTLSPHILFRDGSSQAEHPMPSWRGACS